MNAAIHEAQDKLDRFIEDLQTPQPGQEYFLVKAKFLYGEDGVEHIWLADVTYRGDEFTGTVSNEPIYIPKLKMGDIVTVSRDEISDWMIVENGKILGGYTIRVIRDQLSPEEREQFDREYDFVED